MGVQDIFRSTANFTGIVSNNSLQIGNIIQNAKIEVDEEGTIAAAVTGNCPHNLYNSFQYIAACRSLC